MTPRTRSRGFTLIELLVVIAIIALLSAIMITTLGASRAKGRDAARLSNMAEIAKALEVYLTAASSYPTSLAQLVPTYMPELPKDPDGSDYYYQPYTVTGKAGIIAADRCSGAQVCKSYQLGANLELSDNPALQNDADISTDVIKGTDTTDCSGNVGGRHCYDVEE